MSTIQNEVDAGFMALLDFKFDRYVTVTIVRLAYFIAFVVGLICLFLSIILNVFVLPTILRDANWILLVQAFGLGLSCFSFAAYIIGVRLWLEALVVHYKGHHKELAAVDAKPAITPIAAAAPKQAPRTPTATMPVANVKPETTPQKPSSAWSCRCGAENPPGSEDCVKCGRAWNALI